MNGTTLNVTLGATNDQVTVGAAFAGDVAVSGTSFTSNTFTGVDSIVLSNTNPSGNTGQSLTFQNDQFVNDLELPGMFQSTDIQTINIDDGFNADEVSLTGANSVSVNANNNNSVGSTEDMTISASGSVAIASPISTTGADGSISIASSAVSVNISNQVTASGDVTVTAAQGISLIGGAILTTGSNSTVNLMASGGPISTDASGTDVTGHDVDVMAEQLTGNDAIGSPDPSEFRVDTTDFAADTSETDSDQYYIVETPTGATTITSLDAGTGTVHLYSGTFVLPPPTSTSPPPVVFDPDTSLDLNEAATTTAGASGNPGMLDLNGQNASIAGLSGLGVVTNNGNSQSTLTVGETDATSEFDGTIQDGLGTVALTKTGGGAFTLGATGQITSTGQITVGGGTLIIDGSVLNNSVSPVVDIANGTLGGTGTITGFVVVSAGSFLQPGDNSSGVLTASAITFEPGSYYQVGIDGTAGNTASELHATGSVNLGDAYLQVSADSTLSTANNPITILASDAGSIVGQFANAPEGAVILVNGQQLQINYESNAVTLTPVDITTPPVAIFSGSAVTDASQPNPYSFTVQYTDPISINPATFGNTNLTVSEPKGVLPVTFVSASPPGTGSPLTATYKLIPPGGTWSSLDNGTYTVQIGTSPVSDTAGNTIAAGSPLGTFMVNLTPVSPPPVSPPPVSPPPVSPPPLASQPILIGGNPNGTVELYMESGGTYTLQETLQPFGNIPTDVRTAVGDVNGDGIPDYIFATGPGTPFEVTVISGAPGNPVLVAPFDPFLPAPPEAQSDLFTAGGFVSAGDFLGNGRDQIVVSPDQSGGPRISIYDMDGAAAAGPQPYTAVGVNTQEVNPGSGMTRINNFLSVNANFRGGARTAVGDLNGDGVPDLAIAAGFGGGPAVLVINGTQVPTTSGFTASDDLIGNFFAFNSSLRDGAYLAIGDVLGNGQQDLILGPGAGGPAEVEVLSGEQIVNEGAVAAIANPVALFTPTGLGPNGAGLRVAVVTTGVADQVNVVVGAGRNMPGVVKVYPATGFTSGSQSEPTGSELLNPFGGSVLTDGVFVG